MNNLNIHFLFVEELYDVLKRVHVLTGHGGRDRFSRKRAQQRQVKQAESMVKRSKRIFPDAKVGDTVTVPIPSVERGRGDPRNMIGVVEEKESSGLYTIVVKKWNFTKEMYEKSI